MFWQCFTLIRCIPVTYCTPVRCKKVDESGALPKVLMIWCFSSFCACDWFRLLHRDGFVPCGHVLKLCVVIAMMLGDRFGVFRY